MNRLQRTHIQALIDAIEDCEMHADMLVDGTDMEEMADRLAEVLEVVREAVRNNNGG